MHKVRHTLGSPQKFEKRVNTLLANYTENYLDPTYRAKPLPSTGVFSVLQSFCPKTVPSDEQGFSVFPNGTYVFESGVELQPKPSPLDRRTS